MCCVVLDRVVAELDSLIAGIGERFTRPEPRGRAGKYVWGLMSGLERKNGWTQAERAGEGSSDGMQRLLRKADWDVDGVRDDVRGYELTLLDQYSGVYHSLPVDHESRHFAIIDDVFRHR